MIARLFAAVGVDAIQWRALVQAALRVDMRTVGVMHPAHGRRGKRGANSFVNLLLTFGLMGLFAGVALWMVPSTFAGASLLAAYVIFSVGSSLLLEFHSIVLSPDDYRMLGYQPISSRTFFAARMTSVLIYVWSMTGALACVPLLVALLARWGGVLPALALLAALFVAATTTAFWAIGFYALLLRYVPIRRLRHAMGYLHLAVTFVLYGSWFLLPQLLAGTAIVTHAIPADGWILLLPGAWFATYLQIAIGAAQPIHVALAGGSLLLLAAGIAMTSGRVSLDYADKLALLMTEAPRGASPARGTNGAARGARRGGLMDSWFRDGERRALALVIRGLFRHDMKFRLGVLGILPLTLVYLLAGASRGTVVDPFLPDSQSEPQIYYFAVLFFPMMLKQALSNSDAFKASWIFYASPVQPSRLVFAMNELVLVYFVLPYLLVVGGLLAFFFAHWGHLAVLLITLGLLTHASMLAEVSAIPQLPLTQPATRGGQAGKTMVMILLISFFGAALPSLLHFVFQNAFRTLLFLGGLALLNALFFAMARWRVERLVSGLEIRV